MTQHSRFATTGQRIAAKLPHSEKHFSDYFSSESINKPANSFAFYNVQPTEVMLGISQGHSCPIRILKCASGILSIPLAAIVETCLNNPCL